MTEIVSDIKVIPYHIENVYQTLSDMKKMEPFKDCVPTQSINDLSFDTNSCSFKHSMLGLVKVVVLERRPETLVKFGAENLPFDTTIWLQIAKHKEIHSKIRITVHADLNQFMKPLVFGPMKDALEQTVVLLASLPYDRV